MTFGPEAVIPMDDGLLTLKTALVVATGNNAALEKSFNFVNGEGKQHLFG